MENSLFSFLNHPFLQTITRFASSHQWLTLFLTVLLATTTLTRLYTGPISRLLHNYHKFRFKNAEPLQVPYWIPFFGNVLSVTGDLEAYFSILKKNYKSAPLKLTVLGKTVYLITDVMDVNVVYKRSKDFVFEPVTTYMMGRMFGTSEKARRILRNEAREASAGEQMENKEQEKEQVSVVIHKQYAKYLQGKYLEAMTEKFVNVLVSVFEKMVREKLDGGKGVFETELYDWVKKAMFQASVIASYGECLEEVISFEELFECIWKFDAAMTHFVAGVPRWVMPEPYRARAKLLKALAQWQEYAAKKAEEDGYDGANSEENWDRYFGAALMRNRFFLFRRIGLTLEDAASNHLAFLFALTSNSTPATLWGLVHALRLPTHMANLRSEISTAITNPPPHITFDIKKLTSSTSVPLFMSHFQEILRLCVSSLTTRLVQNDVDFGNGIILKRGAIVIAPMRLCQVEKALWDHEGGTKDGNEENKDHFISSSCFSSSGSKEFDPTRFLPAATSALPRQLKSLRDKAMRPFGGGVSLCPGRNFAVNETIAFVAVALTMFEIEVVRVGKVEVTGRKVNEGEKEEVLFGFKKARSWEGGERGGNNEEIGEAGWLEVGVDQKSFNLGGMTPDREVWVRIKMRKD